MSGFLASIAGATYAPPVAPGGPAVAFDGTGDYYEGTAASSSGVADSLYTTFAGLVFKTTGGGGTAMNLIQVQLGTASGNNGFSVGHWDDGGILPRQPDNSGSDTAMVYGNAGIGIQLSHHRFSSCTWYNAIESSRQRLSKTESYR